MTGSGRIPRIGKLLAAGALIGLAGCQQVSSRPAARPPLGFGNDPKGAGNTITPAQEADVQISMGRAAEQQGDLEQAMAAYRAALDRDKSRADAYARLAVLNDKQGKFHESAELYRKALAARPGDADIFCDMGYSFYLQRRWAEAEMNLRQSIAINPDHRRAHNNLALLLVRDSRLEDALVEFRKAGNDPVQAHMNLAFALTVDQRWESARAEYERALAIDPTCQLAKDRLDQLNILVAKRESPGGARPVPAPLVTATAAQTARREQGPTAPPEGSAPSADPRDPAAVRTATSAPTAERGPDGPAAPPEQSDPTADRRDPALHTTVAVSRLPAPRYGPRKRLAIPPLSAETDAMARLWATADSAGAAAAPPPRSLDAPSTQGPDSHPKPIPPPRSAALLRAATLSADAVSNPEPVALDPTRKSTVDP